MVAYDGVDGTEELTDHHQRNLKRLIADNFSDISNLF